MSILNKKILTAVLYGVRNYMPDGTPRFGIAPIFHWGPWGIGKTEIGTQLGRELDFDYIHPLIPSNCAGGDIGGIPFLDKSGKFFRRVPAEWVHKANAAKRALIIVDEFGDAPPAIQAELNQVVNERRVGDTPLGGHVRFLCFGNPVEQSTNGYPLAGPTANRGGHVEIHYGEEDREAFRRWLISDGGLRTDVEKIDGDALEAKVQKEWPKHYAKAAGLISAYVGNRKSTHEGQDTLLHTPKREDPARSRAHQTPRTMHMATEAVAAAELFGLDETDTDAMITMFVGEGVAGDFAGWRNENLLPDLEDVLDGKVQWKHDPSRPDATMALFDGCTSVVVGAKKTKQNEKRAIKLWDLMEPLAEDDCDLIWVAADSLCNHGYRRVCNSARKVMVKLRDSYQVLKDMDAA